MKKKKWLPLTGLVLVCHLALTACQTKPEKENATPPSQTTTSSSQKTPSSDKKQAIVVTEIKADGYTTLVDGKSKFVKGKVPKDAKFSEETLAPKDYKLDKKDIQYEVEQGYIIKLKDRFYYYPKEKSTNATKTAEKAIPGVTVPTSDGFQLTDDSKILSKTKDGIVVDHDGHSHFIFYSDLKDTKFAHLIPQGADLSQKPSGTTASATAGSTHQSGKTSANDGHHYVFNPADIVAEDEFGYTVRHDDHFHYIPKSSLGGTYTSAKPGNGSVGTNQAPSFAEAPSNQAERPSDPVNHHTPSGPEKPNAPTSPGISTPSNPSIPSNPSAPSKKIAGIDYPTSDGFLFDGSGIKGWTDLGLLVDHDGHLHLILKSDLARSKWKHLLKEDTTKPTPPPVAPEPSKPEQPTVPNKPSEPAKPEQPTVPSKPSEPAKPETPERDLLAEKQAYLAKQLGLNPEDIQITEQNGQKLFVYPHGDHSHAIAADKVIIGQPIEDPHADPHAHQAVGMATLKAIGFDDDIIQDILHADAPTPFPATETNPENMKAWLATVKSLNIGQRENALKRFGLDLMPNLETLGVGFTKIDDVTPILKFKQLKNLFLTDTGITDYSFLKELPNLEGIDISQNGLTSLDFLKDYPQLKTLAVTGSNLTDISVLSHLPNLESLNLDYNQLTDLTPLANLSKLKVVSLDHNKITDLSPLSQKSDLTRLFVSHNDGVKLATLKAPSLEELTVENSGLTSLGFLKHLPSLVDLNANHNAISSLSGLDQAANLRTLNVSKNQIASLRLPAGPAKLETLNISHNRLTSLEGIQNFEALDQLNAGHNQLATLSISQPNKSITYLEVNNNHIPAEELEPNEQKIPNGIARYFPSTRGGDISENSVIADDHTDELPTATDDQEQPSPEAELSDIDIKRNYIAKHTNLPADQVVLMETDKGQAFMYPHGNHHHVVYLKDIDVTQPFDDGHGNKQTMPPAPSEPSKPSDQDVAPLPENLEKKRRELAESLGLSTENLRPVTANGKVIGFEYPHEDHYHTILISDEETEKPEHSPEEVKELKAHVRKLYGLLKGTPVSIKNGLVTFAIPHPHQPYDPSIDYYSDEPDPRFDAGHVHPYAVALDRIGIPKKTGNPELDYENELLAFSKLSGIPVSQVKIEKDKFFVLPGHGHDHYINIINSEEGLKAYRENSLPAIQPHLASGEFSKEKVSAELDRIQELAESKWDKDSLDYRRILRALDQHRADIDSGTRSSTQAYLDALKDFEKRHVLKETPEPSSEMAENPLEKQYNQLSDQIKKLSDKTLKSYGIERSNLLERLKSAAIDQNKVGIDAIEGYIKAIVRTEAAPNDHLPRVAYMDYFLRHVDSEFLPADLREKVAENILALRKDDRNQTFRTQLEQLVALKEQVKQAIAQAQKQPVKLGTSYEEVNKAKTDLVGHVNHWAGIFHYAITDQEKTDGFDRNLQVMPAIKPEANQDDSQPVTTEPVSETPPSDPSGPADSPEKPEKPSVPAPKDTEKEAENPTSLSSEERQAKLINWLNQQSSTLIRAYNIDQKIWLDALEKKDDAILDQYDAYSAAINRIEAQKNDIGSRTAHLDYFLRHVESAYLDHPLRQSVADKLIQLHTGDSWDYKKSLTETVDLKNKVKSAQTAAKTHDLLDSPAYQQYMTEKEALVSWVNLRREHFIKRNLITEEELKEGFDQKIVYEAAKTPAKPVEASLAEKDLEQPVEESGKTEETVPVESVENKDTQPDELIENSHHLEETVTDTDNSETRTEKSEDKQDETEKEGI